MPNHLGQSGLRATERRKAVLAVIERAKTPLTADEIHAEAIKTEKMGLSTTYRVLSQLTAHALLMKNEGGDGRCYYQLNTPQGHRHTLHCTACGAVVPIEGCPLAALENRLRAETGFLITGHSLTFTGLCPACQPRDGVPER